MSAASNTQRKVQDDSKGISKLFSRMTKVHEVNRKHDHALSVRVDELRQKEHMERVRRYSDVRVLQRTLSEMQMEKSRMTHTFTPEEIDNDEVAPVMSWRKIQLKRFQTQPRVRQRRRSNAAQTLLAVTDNTEFTAKNKFRSAVMAVCLSKALLKIPEKNKMSETPENQTVRLEKNKSVSTINWIKQLKHANEDKLAPTHTPDKIESIEPKNETEKCESSRPETSETERSSQVLDILRNSSAEQSKSSWARPADKKVNPVPTFGQLHPARRSSLPRRPGDPKRRRPSTSDNMDNDSPQFFMDKTGTVRRLSRPTIKDDIDDQGSRGLRSHSSSDPGGSTRGTPRTCKVYSADTSRWDVLNDASESKNGTVQSPLERKKSELLKRDNEVMERLRKFLDSTMP
nr:uncharacterized protein LOC129258251 [Lytechinus pictus]